MKKAVRKPSKKPVRKPSKKQSKKPVRKPSKKQSINKKSKRKTKKRKVKKGGAFLNIPGIDLTRNMPSGLNNKKLKSKLARVNGMKKTCN